MSKLKNDHTTVSRNSEELKGHVSVMEQHFSKFGLDIEVVDHLWHLPAASIYGVRGEPRLDKTLKSVIDGIRSDHLSPNSPAETAAIAANLKMTVEQVAQLDIMLFELLFKGVNKSLPMPILAAKMPDSKLRTETTITTAHSMAYLNDDDHVSLSPKALIKFYKYPEHDAKAIFKNIKTTPLFEAYDAVRLVKPKANAYYRNCYSLNHSNPAMWMWSFTQSYQDRALVQFDMSRDYTKALELTDRPLPSFSLNTWKDIAKRRYERLNADMSWNALSVANQKRRLVNVIRHNSVSYIDSWSNANPEHVKHLHDISFDRTLRKIITEYPYLADECRRQLDDRGIGLDIQLDS
ncbi:hypothetical protein [Vibrio crassostreae]|uniref:hypothetical protein n=1 Tax=Vibrio crassostreae TaxID=246167 RepID=UPI001B3020C7|nr:hypothetical protein [Vibrio crassostreae]